MLIGMLLMAVMATLALAKETPCGKALHRLVVEIPANALNRLSIGHLLLALAMLTLIGLVVRYGGTDGLQMIASSLPDLATWITTFEVGTYLDALAILAAISVIVRARIIRPMIAPHLAALMPRRRSARPRDRRSRRQKRSTSDDCGEDSIRFAYAI